MLERRDYSRLALIVLNIVIIVLDHSFVVYRLVSFVAFSFLSLFC